MARAGGVRTPHSAFRIPDLIFQLVAAGALASALIPTIATLVSRGEAPFGIVYATDALADPGVRVVDTFPAASHPPIVYPAAITASSKSPAAKPLLDFLRSASARATWEKFGFAVAQ